MLFIFVCIIFGKFGVDIHILSYKSGFAIANNFLEDIYYSKESLLEIFKKEGKEKEFNKMINKKK